MYARVLILALFLVASTVPNEAAGQILGLPVTLGGSGQANAGSASTFSAGGATASGAAGGSFASQTGASSEFAGGFGATGLDGYVANAADLQAAAVARSARAGFGSQSSSEAGVAWGQSLQRTSFSALAGATGRSAASAGSPALGGGAAFSGAADAAAGAVGTGAGAVHGGLDFASMGQMGARLQKMSESDPRAFQAFLDAHQGLRWKLQGVKPGVRAQAASGSTASWAQSALGGRASAAALP